MADDMVKINRLNNEMNIHKENELIREKNAITTIMNNIIMTEKHLTDDNKHRYNELLSLFQKTLNNLLSDLENYRLELNNLKYRLIDLNDRIRKVKAIGYNIDIKQRRNILFKEIKRLNAVIKNNMVNRENILIAQTTSVERRDQIIKCLKRYEEIDNDNNTCRAIEVMFNANDNGDGIIEYIIRENILPYVKDIANKIFNDLNVDYNIKFNFVKKEQIDMYVRKGNDINNIDYNCTSGFESELIDIVIKYIFCQINSKVRADFFIIDEGLKSSDKENRGNLGKIINMLKSTFKWILTISHDDHLKDMYDKDVFINSVSNTFSRISV
jgi:DNA repair exonuclease SbcCD ATPase subunit